VLWVRALWQTFGAEVRALPQQWRRIDWLSVGVVALGGVVLITHESFGFKIVMDEIMLLGTSMSMHFEKNVLTPLRGSDIQGVFVIMEGIVDKRPLFFPFLLSLVHDIFGYRPANIFVLNATLAFVFLGLVFVAGRQLAGRVAGWLGVALFAGLPLLAQNATGGGFDLLNLVMIVTAMLLAVRFVERRDEASLTAFFFAGLLMAQVRYESAIFLLPVALVILWVWARERRPILSWPIVAAPLLMIHYPLQHRIFDLRASSWEMFSKPGYTKPFAVQYIPENLDHALRYFFAKGSDQPNSLVLSTLGLLAVFFFALMAAKRVRSLSQQSAPMLVTLIFSVGFAIQFGLMMCYFWGKFDDIVIRRLSLPTQLGMGLAVLAVLPEFGRAMVAKVLLAIAAFGIVALSIPAMASNAYSQEYIPAREVAWRRQFMADHPRNDYLMIDNDSILWLTHKVSATPTVGANKRREALVYHLRNRTFSDMYVFQRYNIDEKTHEMTLREGDDLGPAFVLETVREERLGLLKLTRISRVKEIREGETVLSTPDPQNHPVPKDRAEIDRMRQKYLENFIKQLP
jgi:hypothetical protein